MENNQSAVSSTEPKLPDGLDSDGLNPRKRAELAALITLKGRQAVERKRDLRTALSLTVGALLVVGLGGGIFLYKDHTDPVAVRQRNVQALISHMPTVVPIDMSRVSANDNQVRVSGNRDVVVSIIPEMASQVEINQEALKKTVHFLEGFDDSQKIYHLIDSGTLEPLKDGYHILSLRSEKFPVTDVKINFLNSKASGDLILLEDLADKMLFVADEKGKEYLSLAGAGENYNIKSVCQSVAQAIMARQEGLSYDELAKGSQSGMSTFLVERDVFDLIPQDLGTILTFKN